MDLSSWLLFLAGLNIVLGILEWRFPAETGQPFASKLHNALLTLLFILVGGAATMAIVGRLPGGTPRTDGAGPIVFLLAVAAALFAADLLYYWYHRAQHAFPRLWQIHELHHTERHLNATTTWRVAWLEHPVQNLLISVPIAYAVRQVGEPTIALSLFTTTWFFFAHSNLRLHLGRLTPVFLGPQLHRIHHSRLPEHRDKNFAQFFPVIDIVFGTYHAPAKDEYPPTGTDTGHEDPTLLSTLTDPVIGLFRTRR